MVYYQQTQDAYQRVYCDRQADCENQNFIEGIIMDLFSIVMCVVGLVTAVYVVIEARTK